MKKTIFTLGTCVVFFFLAATLAAPGPQLENVLKKVQKYQPPTITSITEDFYPMAVNLVLHGMNFPSKHGSGGIERFIRLVAVGGTGDPNSYTYYAGQQGNWTPNQVDDLLGFYIPTGRRFRIGLFQQQEPSGTNKMLISNELEFLVRMNLDHVQPDPVPITATEVEVFTATHLGPQGARSVWLSNLQAQITQWLDENGIFKIKLPANIQPGKFNLFVMENGIIVSKQLPVQLISIK